LEHNDIICLFETWASSIQDYKNIFPDFVEYCSIGTKRSIFGRTPQGRIQTFVKRWIKNTLSIILVFDKVLFGTDKDVALIGCYLPPESSNFYEDKDDKNGVYLLYNELLDFLSNHKDYVYLLCTGDFNA
jgi:hypothetical protein